MIVSTTESSDKTIIEETFTLVINMSFCLTTEQWVHWVFGIITNQAEADPGGANPAMAPHRSWQWSFPSLEGRKSNDRNVNLWKSKGFGPPIDVG